MKPTPRRLGDYRPLGSSLFLWSTTQGQQSISRSAKGKYVKRRLPRALGKLEGKPDGLDMNVVFSGYSMTDYILLPTDLTLDTRVVSTSSPQRAA